MNDTETIEWGYNCLTDGVHHGRPEALWNLPLRYATSIFRREPLRSMVIARIHNDALQIVDHFDGFDEAWAAHVRDSAEEMYDRTLQIKVGEIANYYKTAGFELEGQEIARRVIENKLNPGYEPLHHHDSINLLCRIIGQGAKHKVATQTKES